MANSKADWSSEIFALNCITTNIYIKLVAAMATRVGSAGFRRASTGWQWPSKKPRFGSGARRPAGGRLACPARQAPNAPVTAASGEDFGVAARCRAAGGWAAGDWRLAAGRWDGLVIGREARYRREMTLRDITVWFDGVRAGFMRDLEIAFSASPLDWPLYMLGIAVVAAFVAFNVLIYILVIISETWEKLRPAVKSEEDADPGPVSNFIVLAMVFIIAWLLAFGIMVALMEAVSAGVTGAWISLAVATGAASFLIYLIRLGRRVG